MRLDWQNIAYMGDDIPDLSVIRRVGLGITVPNACSEIKKSATMCTNRKGGEGAVREICELIMQIQGTWRTQIDAYL